MFGDRFGGEGFAYARRAGEAGILDSAWSWANVEPMAEVHGEECNGLEKEAYRRIRPWPVPEMSSSKASLCTD